MVSRVIHGRGWRDAAQKALDTPECLLDLVETRGIGTANVSRAAGSEGVARNDGDPRLMQQPGREIVRREAGRDDRRGTRRTRPPEGDSPIRAGSVR